MRYWIGQYSFIYLNEKVNNTDNDKYWDKPHIGVSIQETWSFLDYEDLKSLLLKREISL